MNPYSRQTSLSYIKQASLVTHKVVKFVRLTNSGSRKVKKEDAKVLCRERLITRNVCKRGLEVQLRR